MKIIKIENRIAIPVIKIDYIEVDEDEAVVTVVSNGTEHTVYYKTCDSARDGYEKILEAMEY